METGNIAGLTPRERARVVIAVMEAAVNGPAGFWDTWNCLPSHIEGEAALSVGAEILRHLLLADLVELRRGDDEVLSLAQSLAISDKEFRPGSPMVKTVGSVDEELWASFENGQVRCYASETGLKSWNLTIRGVNDEGGEDVFKKLDQVAPGQYE